MTSERPFYFRDTDLETEDSIRLYSGAFAWEPAIGVRVRSHSKDCGQHGLDDPPPFILDSSLRRATGKRLLLSETDLPCFEPNSLHSLAAPEHRRTRSSTPFGPSTSPQYSILYIRPRSTSAMRIRISILGTPQRTFVRFSDLDHRRRCAGQNGQDALWLSRR